MMLTPTDIQNKRFEKGMSGYKPDDVNAYLSQVSDYVAQLQAENADLLGKMEVLAEKLEQYREDEDSLRAALIGAQKLGDSVVKDAKKKAEMIMAEANAKARELITDAKANIDKESLALNRMQMEVAKFKSQILNMYKHHIEVINSLPADEISLSMQEAAVPQAEVPSEQFAVVEGGAAQQADAQMAFTVDYDEETGIQSDAEMMEAAEQAEGGEDAAFPKRKASRFGPLKFGEGYDLTRDE